MTARAPTIDLDIAPGSGRRAAMAAAFAAILALVFALPPSLFGYLSWRQFEFFRFSYYIPHEELFAALREGDAAKLFHAPLFTANMTSGLPIANMFTLTLGQLALSLALGALIALNVAASIMRRRRRRARGALGLVASIGLALAATAAASATGLVGCHPGLAGGLVSLLGVPSRTAAALAIVSPFFQLALIGLLWLSYRRLRRSA